MSELEKNMSGTKIGFIGGGALAESMLKSLTVKLNPADIYVAERRAERCDELKEKYGVNASSDAVGFMGEIDILVLAVKPKDASEALFDIKAKLQPNTIVASVVAGLKLASIGKILPRNPITRVMPNLAQAVGEGMAAWARGNLVTEETAAKVEGLWSLIGKAVEVPETMLDAVTGLSGSGPAFAFIIMEGLADGGVAAGLSRPVAIKLAAQTLLGAAQMVLTTGLHPGVLKDQVTSPAGTTITGLRVLEQRGVRSAMMEAVIAAAEKSRELGK